MNLVTGVNNVGKTTLLEAFFLLVGGFNPELPYRVNLMRGWNGSASSADELWGWLFQNNDTRTSIEITGVLKSGIEDRLKLSLGSELDFESSTQPSNELHDGLPVASRSQGGAPSFTQSIPSRSLVLSLQVSGAPPVSSRISLGANGQMRMEQPDPTRFRPGVFMPTGMRPGPELSDRRSRCLARGQKAVVENLLRHIEPTLEELLMLSNSGVAVVHGRLKSGRHFPLPLLGDGFGRLLSMALALVDTRGGVVLVDEIENGLHHSAMGKVWKGLAVMAEGADVQLVATTHSEECIRSATDAFERRGEDQLALVQLFRLKEKIGCRTLDRDVVRVGIDNNIELR